MRHRTSASGRQRPGDLGWRFPPRPTPAGLLPPRLRAVGADYQVTAESHQPEVLRQLVALGIGWTVLPVIQGEAEPAPLRRAANTPTFDRTLVLAQRTRAGDNPALGALLQLMAVSGRAGGGSRQTETTLSFRVEISRPPVC